jgi:hypothetical protein
MNVLSYVGLAHDRAHQLMVVAMLKMAGSNKTKIDVSGIRTYDSGIS